MSIRVALTHKTFYDYDRLVNMAPHVVRLRPAPHNRTPVVSYSLKVEPQPHFLNWQQDPHSNWLARVVFPEKVKQFHVSVDLVVDMDVINPFDFFVQESAEEIPFKYEADEEKDLLPFLKPCELTPKFKALLATVDRSPRRTIDFIVYLNALIQQHVKYLIRMEAGVQTPEQTLEIGSGSCRDSAWLLVNVLRHLGMASRFVSGYLIQLKPDVKSLDGPSGTEVDFTDLHAWTEVFLPGAGWVGLDPTSGLLTGEGHIPLACSPSPGAAAPITGALDDCKVTFQHEMNVTRIAESPRVTKPYTEAQWAAIDTLGEQVDKVLKQEDVRLTMGGEPTFVAADNMDAPEWTTDAVGEEKLERAKTLTRRLFDEFAPGGLIHDGQGKWYPGESLPRWALTIMWRKDGKPVWKNPDLLSLPPLNDGEPLFNKTEQFAQQFCSQLGIAKECAAQAYEDPWHYLEEERQLPIDVTAIDNKLKNEESRARLATVFERGLDKPRGIVLPIQRWHAEAAPSNWFSEVWEFRSKKCFLIPGDSSMGLRLPLESLPDVPEDHRNPVVANDPFAPRGALPSSFLVDRHEDRPAPNPAAVLSEQSMTKEATAKPQVRDGFGYGQHVRTAMCFEPRDGKVYVFMPPVSELEDYLELLESIEKTAEEMQVPVVIEGYLPPTDHRLEILKVTPDPGVIEVNIHPAADWPTMKNQFLKLYEHAHLTKLGTEKFDVDGRHVGTGGGNHIVVGGATPADSPFLRRPDMLGSLIRFWQNHPSLSYLFSGLFIGPTSQAPRIDEARDDVLYELELALRQLPEPDEEAPLWIADRTLRNLMTDLTGNTHRSEICIDKLYSPDSSTGRLGLVEFRSFEMPPHAQMSLVQQLLLRALIARFWQAPYKRPLIEWGNNLRDQFMLQHYIEKDLKDVLSELKPAGFDFDMAWFAPHLEFRFPRIGSVAYDGITMELTRALEPWIVLGEEPGGGGTTRYVDSSVERVQLKLSQFKPGRYVVTCNGEQVPLQPTATEGEFVAGVRFRAWQPPNCLHPNIEVQAPLQFEIVDTWSSRVLGGCNYHVSHPGGLSYDSFPVNSYEAEGRRLSRFGAFGHRPGEVELPRLKLNPKYPGTLDLRWAQLQVEQEFT